MTPEIHQDHLTEAADLAHTAERRGVTTLAEALPLEQARVREILGHYRAIGPVGMFGAAFIEADLREADAAVMSGDVVRMLRAHAKLKEIEG